MTFLPDVNLLLALAWANHTHHETAHYWFNANANAGWATCILTQSGFLRLSLNPKIVGVKTDGKSVCALLGKLVSHPSHTYVTHAPDLAGPEFHRLFSKISGHRQVTDAALLLFARAHQLKLVTFDRAIASLLPDDQSVVILPSA